ncbi:hypothetical protein BKA59DRAFT_497644 [Fusarium tricinctum]|uniref:Rhodopsin domain-containing protein n=1 Tax=Fusarium tricinctum TaxID=61284 RepID=A0A8K0W5D7_9HYPO|nr:hypothetical protein BKA59DRAFT_497644 [Fusarium tricinctum]
MEVTLPNIHPTQKVVTDTNKSPLIQVLTLMFLVIFLFSCSVRIGTKIRMIKALRVDDMLIIVATVFAIGQSIATFIECNNGLGKPANTLDSSEIVIFFKLLCTVGLRIMSRESQKWILFGCNAVVGGWGISALLNLFQCKLPTPWIYANDKKCIDRTAFWTYYSITNIATDISTIIAFYKNILKIQIPWSKKILVMSVFGGHILHSLPPISPSRTGKAAIALQLVQCLSIVTVCIPSFRPLFNGLESGQIRIDDLRRQDKSGSSSYPSKRPRYSGYRSSQISPLGTISRTMRSSEEATVTESQLSTVHELTDLSKLIARGATKLTIEQKGGAWDEPCRTSHAARATQVR